MLLSNPWGMMDAGLRMSWSKVNPAPFYQFGYSILIVSNMIKPFGRYCWSTG
jgi:hypothetical protein